MPDARPKIYSSVDCPHTMSTPIFIRNAFFLRRTQRVVQSIQDAYLIMKTTLGFEWNKGVGGGGGGRKQTVTSMKSKLRIS